MNEQEVRAISRYSSHVHELNRGLEYAADCLARDDAKQLDNEYSRIDGRRESCWAKKKGRGTCWETQRVLLMARCCGGGSFYRCGGVDEDIAGYVHSFASDGAAAS